MLFLSLTLPALVHAADTVDVVPYDLNDFEVLREQRLAELGIELVLEEDGESYHYALPEGLDTPEVIEHHGLTYVYDGQEVYGPETGRERTASWVHPREHLTDVSYDPDTYLGVGVDVTVDQYGRRWLLAGFDEPALWDRLDAYDALVDETVGLEPDPQERAGIEYDALAGEVEEDVLDTDLWVLWDCAGDDDFEVVDHVYGGTTDNLVNAHPLNVREKKTVMIIAVGHSSGVQYLGSGVMVDDDTVLTAAHVIANTSGYTDVVNIRVCSFGNVESGASCHSVASVSVPGAAYDRTIPNDFGVIELNSAFSPSLGWMAMSTAGDTTLAAATHYHDGYPAYQPACDSNATTSFTDTIIDGTYLGYNYATSSFQSYPYFGAWEHTAYGPVYGVMTGYVRFNVSGAGGMSGGPYYYCPSGCTDTSGAHFVTAISHGHRPPDDFTTTDGWTSGAKARDFRDWVIAHM